MSGRELPKPSPFIISKTILKHPSRENSTAHYTQSKHQNLGLYITKKHSELKARYGLSSRNHTIAYIVGQGPEGASEDQKDSLMHQPATFEETLDPITKKVYDGLLDQRPKDFFIFESKPAQKKKTMRKKAKMFSREQALRAYVYSSFKSEIVDKLYGTYKGKQKEYNINKVKKTVPLDVEGLINRRGSMNEKPEDYFLDQTIRDQGVNASAILGVGELKTKDVDKKSPKTEAEREIELIFDKFHQKEKSKLMDHKIEQQHVINLFRQATVGKLNANNIQLSKIRDNLERADGMYQVHEEFMRKEREKTIRESKVKFVRNEDNLVKKIQQKARVSLAKAISEYSHSKSPDLSPIRSASPLRTESRWGQALNSFIGKTITNNSPQRRTGSIIHSANSSAINFRAEFRNTSPSPSPTPVKVPVASQTQTQSFPRRSSSVPKILMRKPSVNTSIEGFDASFQQNTKPIPYSFRKDKNKASSGERGRKNDLSQSHTDKFMASTVDTNRLQSGDDRLHVSQASQDENLKSNGNITQTNISEILGQTRDQNTSRTNFSQAKPLTTKRNINPMMRTVTSQSSRSMYSNGGGTFFGLKKKIDPLAELKNSFQVFQTQTENFFRQSEKERKGLDAKITKTMRDTEKNFLKIQKESASIPEKDTDEIIHYANQRLFKKELVSKIVASIEDKEEAMQAIQKKKFLAEMSKQALKNLGKK